MIRRLIANPPLVISFIVLIAFATLYFLQTKAENPNIQAKVINKLCKNAKNDLCYIKQFTQLAKRHDLAYTLATLAELQKQDPLLTGCHFISHVIADEELAKNPKDWKNVMAQLPINDCTGGYLMGLMEGRKKYEKDFQVNSKSVQHICSQVQEQASNNIDETCFHSMGHLLLIETNGDVSEAVTICDGLPEAFRYECYAGVFMENIYKRNLLAHGVGKLEKWDNETVLKHKAICNSYKYLALKACWREISHMFLIINQENPPVVYAACASAPEQTSNDACYTHAVGIMAASINFDHNNLHQLCTPYEMNTDMYAQCIDMVINTISASSSQSTTLATFCASVPQKYQKLCPK